MSSLLLELPSTGNDVSDLGFNAVFVIEMHWSSASGQIKYAETSKTFYTFATSALVKNTPLIIHHVAHSVYRGNKIGGVLTMRTQHRKTECCS